MMLYAHASEEKKKARRETHTHRERERERGREICVPELSSSTLLSVELLESSKR